MPEPRREPVPQIWPPRRDDLTPYNVIEPEVLLDQIKIMTTMLEAMRRAILGEAEPEPPKRRGRAPSPAAEWGGRRTGLHASVRQILTSQGPMSREQLEA